MDYLLNLSPIDGRYQDITKELNPYLSEYALIKYRTMVEIKWLIYLLDKKIIDEKITKVEKNNLLHIIDNFNLEDAIKVKEIENTTKHDVKAIEYFLRQKLKEINLERLNSFIHLTLTSEDVNNTSYNLMLQDASKIYLKYLDTFIQKLHNLSNEYKDIPMLAHTHGQPASPTTVGKEFKVFEYRIKSIREYLEKIQLKSKFSGAVGNYNCHIIAYPNIDWIKLTKDFVESMNLKYNPVTTQIESHDVLCLFLSHLKIINNILKNFNSDMWLYISKGYFYEKKKDNEIGSSVMPHKVNPINYENSMANIEIANSLIDALVNHLSISRMQRDLTDSSKLRNLGVIFGHLLISLNQSIIGIDKLMVNKDFLNNELENNYTVLTEAIQTVLRKNKIENAYELLKDLARGKELSKEELHTFINNLPISQNEKDLLINLTPSTYIGLSKQIVDKN